MQKLFFHCRGEKGREAIHTIMKKHGIVTVQVHILNEYRIAVFFSLGLNFHVYAITQKLNPIKI